MSRESVTTDLTVLQGWPKPSKKKPTISSAEVAAALNLTVFQITARLKGMEGRKLVERVDGLWQLSELGAKERDNPSPSLVAKPKTARLASTNGSMVGPPDDSKVPRIDMKKIKWQPSAKIVDHSRDQLLLLERRLAEMNPKKDRTFILQLQDGIANAKGILAKAKKGAWSHRVDFSGPTNVTVYVAPDGREYIAARAFETADLIMGDTRMRLLMTSPKAKKEAKQQAEQSARELAKEEEKQNARQARVLAEEEAEREELEERRAHNKERNASKGAAKKAVQRKVRPAVAPARKAEVKRGPAKVAGKLHKGRDGGRKPRR